MDPTRGWPRFLAPRLLGAAQRPRPGGRPLGLRPRPEPGHRPRSGRGLRLPGAAGGGSDRRRWPVRGPLLPAPNAVDRGWGGLGG